jgi:chemotaxis protein CheD
VSANRVSAAPERVSLLAQDLPVESGVQRARIQNGEVFASSAPSLVSTVLGSCVASCLYDATAAIGGMNHFMLPDCVTPDSLLPASYGVNAMELLINHLMALGARRDRLQAKVFGGARVLQGSEQGAKVGDANVAFVKEFLVREGIAIVAHRLGGTHPLQVNFFTHTGKVLLRTIVGQERSVAERERRDRSELNNRISQPPAKGAVILF